MSKTIGRKHPTGDPNDYYALCAYCGVLWPRSKMHKDRAKLLVCPDEGEGASALALDEHVANQSVGRRQQTVVKRDGTPDPEQAPNPTPFNPNPYTSFP